MGRRPNGRHRFPASRYPSEAALTLLHRSTTPFPMPSMYPAPLKAKVDNRGIAPDSYLDELIAFLKKAPDEIFQVNSAPVEIYTVIRSSLGSVHGRDGNGAIIYGWDSLLHRKAALAEVMRVHPGLESSWNWNEGVDRTNQSSMRNVTGQETGIFQVSFDSLNLGGGALKPFAKAHGIDRVEEFIPAMKHDHALALEYYARLVRVSIAWAGPILRHTHDCIYPWLSRVAVQNFQQLLAA